MTLPEHPSIQPPPAIALRGATTPPEARTGPRVLTCRTTADLIAALPRLTGFTANDSLFLLLFQGVRARCAMRVDLPGKHSPREWEPLIDLIGEVALRARFAAPGERAIPAIVITTSRTFRDSGHAPWRELATVIVRRLRRDGVPAREACCRAADGWASYLDESAPATGRPLSEIQASPVSSVAEGLAEPPSLAELSTVPEAAASERAAVRLALAAAPASEHAKNPTRGRLPERLTDRGLPPRSRVRDDEPVRALRWIVETAALARGLSAKDGEPGPSPRAVARLGLRANDTDGWFVIALALLTRPRFPAELAVEQGPRAVLGLPLEPRAGTSDIGLPFASLSGFLEMTAGALPDHRVIAAARARVLEACGALPAELRPGPLALAAWLWWLGGVQSVAGALLDRARDIRPDHPVVATVARVAAEPVIPFALRDVDRRSA
ncbi:DUF4192 family protein [Leucobacter sp. CSA2]|uniref:DUF4192 family protein n=1 Tax=Leucobacter edaphi TaxID=2796472 RepID=A0A934QFE7_9MICO|nr:DUF4192 family protein [Leucobacter edaphi]MBK0422607.1 DUF4192 family protein [Leucobacter edaphi]